VTAPLARWLRFNAVGLAGVPVQLAALALLTRLFHWHYLAATAAAVELAVLHNFAWHVRWTWRGQPGPLLPRLLRFHLANGLVSVLSNLALMPLLHAHLPLLPANLAAITLTALLNFALAELFVFAPARPPWTPGR